jgi:hypothetical protein
MAAVPTLADAADEPGRECVFRMTWTRYFVFLTRWIADIKKPRLSRGFK